MRAVSEEQRRAALVRRHLLAGGVASPEQVVDALLALHATDPATVTLSVLARSTTSSISDVSAAMHDRRSLVRWMAMRRTLFVFARNDIPTIQAAVSAPLAASLRRRLLSRLERNGTEPPVDGDLAEWLDEAERAIEAAVVRRGAASGLELRADVPALRTTIRARTRSEVDTGLTSPLLTVLSTDGRLVRGMPVGAWTTRSHRWEPVATWWSEGIPDVEPGEARADLARRWLERFGPATVDDLEWWTGWSTTHTRGALARLELVEVDLHGRPGIDLRSAEPEPIGAAPVAALLPALDPSPMGWRHRDWFTAVDRTGLYDAAGNIGPTVWWDGELIGSWASTPAGIRVELAADRGQDATAAVDAAAARLEQRLDGVVVTPAARTPTERRLSARG